MERKREVTFFFFLYSVKMMKVTQYHGENMGQGDCKD
jgi:hypothetical protein